MSDKNQPEKPIFDISNKLYQQLVNFQENLEKTDREPQSESQKMEKLNSNSDSNNLPNIPQNDG